MKVLTLLVLLIGINASAATCNIDGITVSNGDANKALALTIYECFFTKKTDYLKKHTQISFSTLKSFIDDCANPVCK